MKKIRFSLSKICDTTYKFRKFKPQIALKGLNTVCGTNLTIHDPSFCLRKENKNVSVSRYAAHGMERVNV